LLSKNIPYTISNLIYSKLCLIIPLKRSNDQGVFSDLRTSDLRFLVGSKSYDRLAGAIFNLLTTVSGQRKGENHSFSNVFGECFWKVLEDMWGYFWEVFGGYLEVFLEGF
jgi:hypothetical protein